MDSGSKKKLVGCSLSGEVREAEGPFMTLRFPRRELTRLDWAVIERLGKCRVYFVVPTKG